MIYIIENDKLKVKISSMGAELQSIRRLDDDTEYLWQGDDTYWASRATNLFPICGRLYQGKYTFNGMQYDMMLHGFAKLQEWAVIHQDTTTVTLQLRENAETLTMYPFHFSIEMTYTLQGENLQVTIIVHNLDEKTMYFAVGAHPGFNLPLNDGENFDDYYIEFDEPCDPQKLIMSANCLYTKQTKRYPLEKERFIRLSHSLFDNDALPLHGVTKSLTLRSKNGKRHIHFAFPDMTYLLLWHKPKTQAPYVCIEPWTSYPGLDGKIEDLTEKGAMNALDPEGVYRNTYTIAFH